MNAPSCAPVGAAASDLPGIASELFDRLRGSGPLVHCITNGVVQGFTANVLLAVGASPAMVDIVGEAGVFAAAADGLLVNLGTPAPEQRAAMREAVAAASAAGTPWVLDPVAVGALPVRTALAAELLAVGPTVVRGNASEIIALAGLGAGGRGVDAADTADAALPAARAIAARGPVVAVSGPEDLVVSASGWETRIASGDPLLTRVTGGGCALGALVAAFLAVRGERHQAEAAAAAHAVYGLAAERAAAAASGPGSFAVALLDALAQLDPAAVRAGFANQSAEETACAAGVGDTAAAHEVPGTSPPPVPRFRVAPGAEAGAAE